MRSRLNHLVLLSLVAFLACKKEPPPAPTAPPTTPEAPKPAPPGPEPTTRPETKLSGEPLVWRATKGEDSLVIIGTLHTGGAGFVPAVAWSELGKAKRFAMECDLGAVDQSKLAGRMRLPDDQSLDKLISPESWKILTKASSMPEIALKSLKPWVAAIGIVQSWLSGAQAVDLALKGKADELKLTPVFLESWEDQFDMIEKAIDAKALEVFLADLDKSHKMLDQLVEAYRTGNVDQIIQLTADDPMMTPEARELMLTGRNKKWMPKLLELAKTHDCFVAVGAGHVVGKEGLLDLLEHEGFKIERLKN